MNVLAQPIGYKAMLSFLAKRSSGSGELAALLKELVLDEKGRPAEAIRDEWNAAVQDVLTGSPSGSITVLGL